MDSTTKNPPITPTTPSPDLTGSAVSSPIDPEKAKRLAAYRQRKDGPGGNFASNVKSALLAGLERESPKGFREATETAPGTSADQTEAPGKVSDIVLFTEYNALKTVNRKLERDITVLRDEVEGIKGRYRESEERYRLLESDFQGKMEQEITRVQADHESQLENLRFRHQEELEEQGDQHQKKMDALVARLQDAKDAIARQSREFDERLRGEKEAQRERDSDVNIRAGKMVEDARRDVERWKQYCEEIKRMEAQKIAEIETAKETHEKRLKSECDDQITHYKEIADKAQKKLEEEAELLRKRELEILKKVEESRAAFEAETKKSTDVLVAQYKDEVQRLKDQISKDRAEAIRKEAEVRRLAEGEHDARITEYETRLQQLRADLSKEAEDDKRRATESLSKTIRELKDQLERERQTAVQRASEVNKEFEDMRRHIVEEANQRAETRIEESKVQIKRMQDEIERLKQEKAQIVHQSMSEKQQFEESVYASAQASIKQVEETARKAVEECNKRSAEVVKRLEAEKAEFEERTRQNADVGVAELRIRLETMEKKLAQEHAEAAEREQDLRKRAEDVKFALEQANAKKLEELRAAHRAQIQQMEQTHQAHEAEVRSAQEASRELDRKDTESQIAKYRSMITELENKVDSMRREHVARIVELTEDTERKREEIRKTAVAKSEEAIALYQQTISDLESQLSSLRADVLVREAEISKQAELKCTEFERTLVARSDALVAQYKQTAEESKSLLDKERAAFKEAEFEHETKARRARESFEKAVEAKTSELSKFYKDQISALNTRLEEETAAIRAKEQALEAESQQMRSLVHKEAGERTREVIQRYQEEAQAAQALLEKERTKFQNERAELIQKTEQQRAEHEAKVRASYEQTLKEYRDAAAKAQERLETEREASQKRELERMQSIEREKMAFENEVTTHAESMVAQMKEIASRAREEADKACEQLQQNRLELLRQAESIQQKVEEEVKGRYDTLRKAMQSSIDDLRSQLAKQREEAAAREQSLLQEQMSQRERFEDEVLRRAQAIVAESERTVALAHQQMDAEREKSKLSEIEIRASFEARRQSFENDLRKSTDEIIEKYKESARRAEELASAELKRVAEREASIISLLEDERSQIPTLAQKKAEEIITAYRLKADAAAAQRLLEEAAAKSKFEAEMRAEKEKIETERKAGEQKLKERMDALASEIERKKDEVEKQKLSTEAAEKERQRQFEEQRRVLETQFETRVKDATESLTREQELKRIQLEQEYKEKSAKLAEDEKRRAQKMEEKIAQAEHDLRDKYDSLVQSLEDRVQTEREALVQKEREMTEAAHKKRLAMLDEVAAEKAAFQREQLARARQTIEDAERRIQEKEETIRKDYLEKSRAAQEAELARFERMKQERITFEESCLEKAQQLVADYEARAAMAAQEDRDRRQRELDERARLDRERAEKESVDRVQFEETLKRKFETQKTEIRNQMEAAAAERAKKLREEMEQREAELSARITREREKLAQSERDLVDKVDRIKAQYEDELRAQLDKRDQLDEENRAKYAKSLEDAEQRHRAAVEEMRTALAEQRMRMDEEVTKARMEHASSTAKFEEALREKYTQMIDKERASLDAERVKIKEDLARLRQQDEEALSARLEKMRQAADQEVSKLKEELRASFDREAGIREAQEVEKAKIAEQQKQIFEDGVRLRYEKMLRERDELSAKERAELDAKWTRDLELRELQMNERIIASERARITFEESVRARYQALMSQTELKWQAEAQAAQKAAQATIEKREEEEKARSVVLARERREWEASVLAKYEETVKAQQEQHHLHIEELTRAHEQAQARWLEKAAQEKDELARAGVEAQRVLREALQGEIEAERKKSEDVIDALKASHARELEQIQAKFLEVSRASDLSRLELEESLRKKYQTLTQEYVEVLKSDMAERDSVERTRLEEQEAKFRERLMQLDAEKRTFEEQTRARMVAAMTQAEDLARKEREDRETYFNDMFATMEEEKMAYKLQVEEQMRKREDELRTRYDRMVSELQSECDSRIRSAVESSEQKLQKTIEEQAVKLTTERAARAQYESDIRSQAESRIREEENTLKQMYEAQKASLDADRSKMEDEAREAERKLEQKRLTYETQTRSKFDALLAEIVAKHKEDLVESDRVHERERSKLMAEVQEAESRVQKEKIVFEKDLREKYEAIRESYESEMRQLMRERETVLGNEMQALRETLVRDRRRDEVERQRFEDNLRARHDELIKDSERQTALLLSEWEKNAAKAREALEEELAKERQRTKDEQTGRLEAEIKIRAQYEQKASKEKEELTRQETARQEELESMRQKYERMVADREDQCKREIQKRSQALDDERMRLHEELQLRAKQMQLESAQYEEQIREKYVALLEKSKQQHKEIMDARIELEKREWEKRNTEAAAARESEEKSRIEFEASVKEKYDKMLSAAQAVLEDTKALFESSIAKEREQEKKALADRLLQLERERTATEQAIRAEAQALMRQFETTQQDIMSKHMAAVHTDRSEMAKELTKAKEEQALAMAALEVEYQQACDQRIKEFMESQEGILRQKECEFREEVERIEGRVLEKIKLVDSARIEFEEDCRRRAQDNIETAVRRLADLEAELHEKQKVARDEMEDSKIKWLAVQDGERRVFEQKALERSARIVAEAETENLAKMREIQAVVDEERRALIEREAEMRARLREEMAMECDRLRAENEVRMRECQASLDDLLMQKETIFESEREEQRTRERGMAERHESEIQRIREQLNKELGEAKDSLDQVVATRVEILRESLERQSELKIRETSIEFERQCFAKYVERQAVTDENWKAEIQRLSSSFEAERQEQAERLMTVVRTEQDKRLAYESDLRREFDSRMDQIRQEARNDVDRITEECDKTRYILMDKHATEIAQVREQEKEAEARIQAEADKTIQAERALLEEDRRKMEQGHLNKLRELEAARLEYESTVRQSYERLQEEAQKHLQDQMREKEAQVEEYVAQVQKQRVEFEADVRRECCEAISRRDAEICSLMSERESELTKEDARRADLWAQKQKDIEAELNQRVVEHKREYDALFEKLREQHARELRDSEGKAEKERQAKVTVESRCMELENEIERLTHGVNMWKLEHQKEVRSRYETMFQEMESRHRKDLEDVRRAQSEYEDKLLTLELQEKERVIDKQKRKEEKLHRRALEEQQRKDEEALEEEHKRLLAERLQQCRQRISELWQALETDPLERFKFLWEVEARDPFAGMEDKVAHYADEIRVLSDQIPIMEAVTKREFVKYRLREFTKATSDPSRFFSGNSSRMILEAKQRKELERELIKLNDVIMSELPAFEKAHGRVFMYRGRQYMEIMSNDVRGADDRDPQLMENLVGARSRSPSPLRTPSAYSEDRDIGSPMSSTSIPTMPRSPSAMSVARNSMNERLARR